jgi:2-oxoglutarate ferredoxin oxidoreductase subunit gamma
MQMRKEVFMAGTGGQGVLTIGQLLTYAADADGLQVSYFPVYSPEVRGGSTTCTIVISDGAVGSPISGRPAAMLLMDQVSIDANLARLRDGGTLLYNSSLVQRVGRDDVKQLAINATEKAVEIGSERITNMVMLGAYVGATEAVTMSALENALRQILPERHHKLLPMNMQALEAGAELAKQ